MYLYFAYGSVLSLRHAREWCESHGIDVTPFLKAEPARLDGFRITFDVPSRYWQGLVADLEEWQNAAVEGALFTLDDSMREAVQKKEGVATGLYHELEREVEVAGGRKVKAAVFVANPEVRVQSGAPAARYLDALVEGAQERGLSADWKALLERMPRGEAKPPPPGIPLTIKK